MAAKKTRLIVSSPSEPGVASTRRLTAGDGDDPGDEAPSARRMAGVLGRCPTCETEYSGSERFCPFDGASLEPVTHWNWDDDPLIGRTVSGRYVIESVLAEGGMGTVYKVRHSKLESHFALKLLHTDLAEDPEVAERLIAEARATAAIGHPNIVAVADFGEIDNSVFPELGDTKLPYFVMEYLSGPSLASIVREEGKLSSERVAHIMVQIAGALAAAHKEGIIHRDLKPENIRITHDEVGGEIAKVLDFGVAKVMGASKKTQAGMVFGTPHYMSPEQGQGKPIDHRSDIYSLGVLMYECLTGRVPFVADTFMGVITKHMFEQPAPIPGDGAIDMEPIVQKCLAKTPDARYGSMGEVVAELERAIGGGPTLLDASLARREPDEPRQRWLWATLTVLAAAGAAAAVVHYAGSTEPPAPEPPAPVATPAPSETTAPVRATATDSAPVDTAFAPTTSAAPAPPPSASAVKTAPVPIVRPPRPGPAPKPTSGGDVVDPWDG